MKTMIISLLVLLSLSLSIRRIIPPGVPGGSGGAAAEEGPVPEVEVQVLCYSMLYNII